MAPGGPRCTAGCAKTAITLPSCRTRRPRSPIRQRATESIPGLIEESRPHGLLPDSESFTLTELAATLPVDASGPGISVRGADPPAIAIPLRSSAGEHFVRAEQTVRFDVASAFLQSLLPPAANARLKIHRDPTNR